MAGSALRFMDKFEEGSFDCAALRANVRRGRKSQDAPFRMTVLVLFGGVGGEKQIPRFARDDIF